MKAHNLLTRWKLSIPKVSFKKTNDLTLYEYQHILEKTKKIDTFKGNNEPSWKTLY